MRKDQLHRISESEFFEWLFGFVKFSGLIHDISFGSLTGFVVYLLIGNVLSNANLRDRRGILLATNSISVLL